MLNILGVGCAYPDTEIGNAFLEKIDSSIEASKVLLETGIETRLVSLSPDYISGTFNREPYKAVSNSSCTPTDLVYKAAVSALERAGITAAELGLILGDCSTPLETIPTEAQRLGQRLSVKIPAYDIFSSAASFALHLETVLSFRDDKLPDYILLISSHLISHRLNFGSGLERLYFGDAAAAMVVSTRKPGKLRVKESSYFATPLLANSYDVDLFGHLKVDPFPNSEALIKSMKRIHAMANSKSEIEVSSIKYIGPQVSYLALSEFVKSMGIKQENHWFNVKSCGANPASAPLSILADKWDNIDKNDNILVSMSGLGIGEGYVILQAEF